MYLLLCSIILNICNLDTWLLRRIAAFLRNFFPFRVSRNKDHTQNSNFCESQILHHSWASCPAFIEIGLKMYLSCSHQSALIIGYFMILNILVFILWVHNLLQKNFYSWDILQKNLIHHEIYLRKFRSAQSVFKKKFIPLSSDLTFQVTSSLASTI